MITDTLKKIMKKFKESEFNDEYSKLTPYYKQQRNEVIARRLQRYVEILKLSSINAVSYADAEKLWHDSNNIAGINCEITLGRTLRLWGIHARRLPRSGKAKKTKRPKLEPDKPCDLKLTIDGNEIFVESKLRSNPRTLYDDIMNNPKCYHIHFEDYDYYVLSENDFKAMIVDLEYPNIKESNRKVKYYHDLFNQTDDKTRYIDIVSLKQKTFDYIFIIRPKTMQILLNRCIRY